MNKILVAILALAILVGAFFLFNSYIYNQKQADPNYGKSPKDTTYVVDGRAVTLVNGVSEVEAVPGSASKIVTRYFGNEVTLDLDDDGRDDSVFLLTEDRGGSGTFYYVVAALNKESGYVGSQALLLGDRISPQTTEKGKGKIVIVNYTDRARGEDFSVQPSVGKSIWLLLDAESMQFGEVAQNFEGEADPNRMTLSMKTWEWVESQYEYGERTVPKRQGDFTVTFGNDGHFTATTDCNSMSGSYIEVGSSFNFGTVASTKKYCEGSQESEFASYFENTTGYHFTSRGELILELKFDSGTVVFK